eukprot:CAMPEP_0194065664 /NCGR_PEP_ID=MMETSP0009_2-20130614/85594_1 /TAXON_ID=210454 /ORGANISM="Grammatophora oceanica, Strain CCMP 410" /LENGTH=294 /DNA_ID=CAMNT_0038718533 /DNA_START=1542 /DNA_END=2426 /DNA_ORIENTATION=-
MRDGEGFVVFVEVRVAQTVTEGAEANMSVAKVLSREDQALERVGANNTSQYLLILADNVKMKGVSKTYDRVPDLSTFYEFVGESDCSLGPFNGRLDPVLKLYRGCQLILTISVSVGQGQANGSTYTFQRACLKRSARVFHVDVDGASVPAVFASDVSYLMVLDGAGKSIKLTSPESRTFYANYPVPFSIRTGNRKPTSKIQFSATQFAVVSNDATTGFKLQGATISSLFVWEWCSLANWEYVMLSRVCTREGLFLREPISTDLSRYRMAPKLAQMLVHFNTNAACPVFDETILN